MTSSMCQHDNVVIVTNQAGAACAMHHCYLRGLVALTLTIDLVLD